MEAPALAGWGLLFYACGMRKLTIAALLILAGCANHPLGRYHVVQATEKSVTIKYDAVLSGRAESVALAEAHCAKYGKTAVPHMEAGTNLTPVSTFLCE